MTRERGHTRAGTGGKSQTERQGRRGLRDPERPAVPRSRAVMRGLSPGPDCRLLQTEATKPLLQSAGLAPGTRGPSGPGRMGI